MDLRRQLLRELGCPVAAPGTLGSITTGGTTRLTLTFNRRAAAADVRYTVESSTDLATWLPVSGLAYDPGADPITVQDPVALDTTGITRRFLRIRVAAP